MLGWCFLNARFFPPWIGYYPAKNQQNLSLYCRNMNLPRSWYFYAWFLQSTLLFRQNSQLTVKIWTFLRADIFINVRLFSTNTLLFCRKSMNFVTNCQLFRGRQFFKWRLCLYKYAIILLKIGKIRYFLPRNVKRKIFLGDNF